MNVCVCFTLQRQNLRAVEVKRGGDGAAVGQILHSRHHHEHRRLFRLNLVFPVTDLRDTDRHTGSRKTLQMCRKKIEEKNERLFKKIREVNSNTTIRNQIHFYSDS